MVDGDKKSTRRRAWNKKACDNLEAREKRRPPSTQKTEDKRMRK